MPFSIGPCQEFGTMVRKLWTTAVVASALALCVTSAWAFPALELQWTQHLTPGANPYYLDGNIDAGGVLVGQINYGVRHVAPDGTPLHAVPLGSDTAKSIVRLGDYYYVSGDDSQGIGRLDATGANAWNASSWVGFVNPLGTGPEAIATNGSLLFANDDGTQNRIHAYAVTNQPGSFSLTEQWAVDLPDGHRVRGISYDADSGYLYMHNGGDSAGTTLYAIDAATGTAFDMGMHAGEPRVYQVLRRGDELLVFGTSDNLSVYDLVNDTTIAAGPKLQIGLGLGDLYGAAVMPIGGSFDTLFVTSGGGNLSAFELVPEPTTLSLLGLGGLAALARRRRRR